MDPILVGKAVTTAWSISFLCSSALIALLVAIQPDRVPLRIAVQVAGFVVPIKFTGWYRTQIRERATGAGAGAAVAAPAR